MISFAGTVYNTQKFNKRFEAMRYLIKPIFLQWMVTFSDKNKAFYKHSNVGVLCFITLKILWF